MYKRQAPYQVCLILAKDEKPKEYLIVTELPIKKTPSPEDPLIKGDPFEAPKEGNNEVSKSYLETTSQFYLDEKLTDRAFIHIYLLSVSISDLEAHYTKRVNQSEQDNPITRP